MTPTRARSLTARLVDSKLGLPGLQDTSQELYSRVKARDLLVVSGHHFFYGLRAPAWHHPHECLRLTYSHPEPVVRAGIEIPADELAPR